MGELELLHSGLLQYPHVLAAGHPSPGLSPNKQTIIRPLLQACSSPQASSLPLLPLWVTTPLPPASLSTAAPLLPESSYISVPPPSTPSPLSKAPPLQLHLPTTLLSTTLLPAHLPSRVLP